MRAIIENAKQVKKNCERIVRMTMNLESGSIDRTNILRPVSNLNLMNLCLILQTRLKSSKSQTVLKGNARMWAIIETGKQVKKNCENLIEIQPKALRKLATRKGHPKQSKGHNTHEFWQT